MEHKRRNFQQTIQYQRDKHDLAEYLATLITLYADKDDKSLTPLHAVLDNYCEQKKQQQQSNAPKQDHLLLERQTLNELLELGHAAARMDETQSSAITRLMDNKHGLILTEKCLSKLDEAIHKKHHRVHAAESRIKELAHNAPPARDSQGNCNHAQRLAHQAELSRAHAEHADAHHDMSHH